MASIGNSILAILAGAVRCCKRKRNQLAVDTTPASSLCRNYRTASACVGVRERKGEREIECVCE